jgi:hypothetical protein
MLTVGREAISKELMTFGGGVVERLSLDFVVANFPNRFRNFERSAVGHFKREMSSRARVSSFQPHLPINNPTPNVSTLAKSRYYFIWNITSDI